MGKCPFWSTRDNGVNCFKECVMLQEEGSHDECVFQELLFLDVSDEKFNYEIQDFDLDLECI